MLLRVCIVTLRVSCSFVSELILNDYKQVLAITKLIFPQASHSDIFESIKTEGLITPETDAKLKKIVTEFVAAFQSS